MSMRSKLLFGAALPLLSMVCLGQALAEEPQSTDPVQTPAPAAATEEAEEETIVVTGSRIRRAADETVPVSVIGAEEIENRGFVNAIEAIEQLPLVGAGVNARGDNDQFGANSAFPDILDLGTNRTLTLLNGRRFVSSNQATVFVPDNQNGAQVDLTIINPLLIERTEVVTVGGGPIYGADAVSGVVNIILKDRFEGLEATAQGGLTQYGDGGEYRVTGLWGKNFLNNRANLTIGAEWFDADLIRSGEGRPRVQDQQLGTFLNQLSLNGTDGQPSTSVFPGTTNPLIPFGGLLTTGPQLTAVASTNFFPEQQVTNFTSPTFNPQNLSPFAFAQTAQGSALNPLLFVGRFAPGGTYPTINNPDPSTNTFLPRLAVPLTFDQNGNLVAYDIGDIRPPNFAEQNLAIGGDGFPLGQFTNIQSGVERFSANLIGSYDITSNIRAKSELIFADINTLSLDGPLANAPTGNTTAGNLSIPIYINQNPYFNAQNRALIQSLQAQGLQLPTIGGQQVLYLSRTLRELTGDTFSTTNSRTWRTANSLEGDFQFLNRNFNWDVAFIYGVTTAQNDEPTLLDVEFALATDVVTGPNGNPVCRQQTLATPEPIGVRNPGVAFINTGLTRPVTPTAAQVAACQPLNLFGVGAPSAPAADYVVGSNFSENKSQQFVGSAALGGELIQLPAGALQFNSQFEWRRETNEFRPGPVFGQGLGRNTLGQSSQGALQFFEGGTEFAAPIFGDDFRLPGFHSLEFNGAVRVVNRSISSENNPAADDAPGSTGVTFTGGGRWSPIRDITFRGNRTRSVRSPSVVELVGAGVTGFTGGGDADFACDADNIDGGPPGGIRRANCEAYVQALGLPVSFLDNFQIPNTGSRPAAGASNPGLENEIANNWTVGVVIEPRFIPGLTIESDYYAVDLSGQIGLSFQVNSCFDSPDFPNTIVGGFNVCDSFLPAVPGPTPGTFVVPDANPLTGTPTPPVAIPGSPAPSQAAGNLAFIFFPTLNIGLTELRSLNNTITYQRDLADIFGDMAADWGRIALRGTVYYIRRFDDFPTGEQNSLDSRRGEPGTPKFETRLDVTHNIGPLTHTLQWFRNSATVNNVLIPDNLFPDQSADFQRPAFNTFNYNIAYEVTDNITARVIVNNLTNAQLFPEVGLLGDTVGRRFVFSLNARF